MPPPPIEPRAGHSTPPTSSSSPPPPARASTSLLPRPPRQPSLRRHQPRRRSGDRPPGPGCRPRRARGARHRAPQPGGQRRRRRHRRQVSHTARSLATLCDEYQTIAAAARPSPNSAMPSYIGGLVGRASAVEDPDAQRALDERETAIRARVAVIAHDALRHQPPWTGALGRPALEPGLRQHWMEALKAVAGYRERWSITSPHRPLGSAQVGSVEQLRHRERASNAEATAIALAATRE